MSLSCLRQLDTGVEVRVYVQPRAARNKIVGLHEEELKVALTAPPVDGAANKACRELLARVCRLSKGQVVLLSGASSRHKRLLLSGQLLAEIRSQILEQLSP